ncbi:MAG TPA: cytochrome c peroxidase [Gemmataceae bacterium]|jgi:cytochrome c peroxidase
MARLALLAGFVVMGAGILSADAPPVVPRDTLPAKLPLDDVPLGLDPRPATKENPLTEQRVRLGRRLFFDPVLSADNTVACASCHHPDHGFAGSEPRPRGIRGQRVARRAPSLFNRAYGVSFFWDGRESTLEGQALRPIEDATEMGSTIPAVLGRLRADATYKVQFEAAFADGVTAANLGRALASFERVLLRGDSPVDRFRRRGDTEALTPRERQGLWLYESKGRCWRCHSGANFTDEAYHNTGVSWGKAPQDLGRFAITKKEEDRGRFKTPTLRGVSLTGPYMHDGSLKSLEEVVEFYNRGGGANPNLDPVLAPLNLSKDEMRDLMAFLRAL